MDACGFTWVLRHRPWTLDPLFRDAATASFVPVTSTSLYTLTLGHLYERGKGLGTSGP